MLRGCHIGGATRQAIRPDIVLPRACLAVICASVGLLAAAERPAAAYPQWQLTSGSVRCNECHYAPAGGGLITSYGRDAVGDQLSTFDGDGNLLHGKVTPPRWLAVGADLRGAFVANGVQDPSGATVAAFPMQADVGARVAIPRGLSVMATLGVRGMTRDPDVNATGQQFQPVSASRLISREHYAMWQPEVQGKYVRVGRFFAPYGLRFSEHILYIRRDLGFDQLEETYNLSAGYTYQKWELHVTAFAPDFVRHIGSDERGFAGMYERRLLDDKLAVAGQARIADGPGATRFMWGGVGKLHIERLRTLLLAEADFVHIRFDDRAAGWTTQLVGVAGFSVLPVRGVIATLLVERNQVDVNVRGAAWTAATALVNWFPYPHVELQVMGRLQFPAGLPTAKTLFAQVHYFF
jgi:predicted CxxxxCH...CXXCH cytochrome family protein